MEMNNKKLTFLKYFSCALIVIVFAIVLFINYANKVYAADYAAGDICTGFSFTSKTSGYSGDTVYENGVLTVSATGKAKGTCSSAESGTQTLTIKNTKTEVGTIIFDYTVTLNNGSAKINGNSVSGSNIHFELEVNGGSSVTVVVTSDAAAKTTSIKLSNIISQFDINADITFDVADEGGTYRVLYGDVNEEILNLKTESINAENSITFTALPSSGYKIFCWEINGVREEYLNTTFTKTFTDNSIIKPIFCDVDSAIFTTKAGGYYMSLTEANNAAKSATSSNGSIIIPVATQTIIPMGEYEISSGVTLLIPHNFENQLITTTPPIEAHVTPSVYKTLEVSSGATINVYGTISIGSAVSANGQLGGYNGTPSGQHGEMILKENSQINIFNKAILYCWGYISGPGNIEAKSGSKIYEFFQLKDWRGGTATFDTNIIGLPTGIKTLYTNNKILPFSQYYVQNIESKLTLNYGAIEIVKCYANAGGQQPSSDVSFIGNTSDYMFYLKNGKVIKHYDSILDRLDIEIYGDISISSITLNMYITIKTSDYILPLNNMNIIVHSGQISIAQSAEILPGSRLEIEKDASLIIERGYDLFVYDKVDWKYYTGSAYFYPLDYTAANGNKNKSIRTWAKTNSAEISVDGCMIVRGGFYSTLSENDSSGANIHSNNTLFSNTDTSNISNGSIIFENDAGTKTKIYQVTQSGSEVTLVEITITSVILKGGVKSDKILETVGSEAGTGFQIIVDKDVVVESGYTIEDYYYWGTFVESGEHTIVFQNGNKTINKTFISYNDFNFISYEDSDHFQNIDVLTDEFKIKKWIIQTDTVTYVISLGEIFNMPFNTDIVAYAFLGGFISNDSGDVFYVRYDANDYDSGLVKGAFKTKTQNSDDIKIHYFSIIDGHLEKITNNQNRIFNYNDDLYLVDSDGYVIESYGLFVNKEIGLDSTILVDYYYYFGADNKAYKDGVYFIETNNETYPSGFYRFDADGHLVGKVTHGLVETSNGDLYYIDSTNDSSVDLDNINQASSYVVTNSTIYVTDFDLSVSQSNKKVGLYYFGEDGKMISYKEVA